MTCMLMILGVDAARAWSSQVRGVAELRLRKAYGGHAALQTGLRNPSWRVELRETVFHRRGAPARGHQRASRTSAAACCALRLSPPSDH